MVDQRKDERRGAEAEAEGEDGRGGDAGRAAEGARGVADVVPEGVQSFTHGESFLPGGARSMELPDRVVPRRGEAAAGFLHRVGAVPPGGEQLLGAHLDVHADLGIHVGPGPLSPADGQAERPAHPGRQQAEHRYDRCAAGAAVRMPVTVSA